MRLLLAPARACALVMALALALPALRSQDIILTTRAAESVTPAGVLTELAIDDGVAECILGVPSASRGKPGFGWANKLTPPNYPATLRSITGAWNCASMCSTLRGACHSPASTKLP